jgi:hypothetical protein
MSAKRLYSLFDYIEFDSGNSHASLYKGSKPHHDS